MSSQNAFPGPKTGRPAVRPNAQQSGAQPPWANPQGQGGRSQQHHDEGGGWPNHQQPHQQSQQPAQNYPAFPEPGFGGHALGQEPSFGQWSELQPSQPANRGNYGGYPQHAGGEQADPYAPQFEPYVPPTRTNFASQQPAQAYPNQQQQTAPQWQAPDHDPHGFDASSYDPQGFAPQPARQAAQTSPSFGQQQYHENELSAADWAGPHDDFGRTQHHRGDAHLGFGQAEGGELEPLYDEEEGEYEDEEEAPRSRRPLMIVAALVGAIVVGGGMAYGYKTISGGSGPQGEPPVIKSAELPSKTKPADAGGRQFPYSDTKIMGRLGDGTSSASAEESSGSQAEASDSSASASASEDNGGARKVSTLVVGRDGSIQSPPPAPAPEPEHEAPPGGTGVPGTALIDFGQPQGGMGHQGGMGGMPPPAPAVSAPPVRPTPLNAEAASAPAKKVKPVTIAKVNSVDTTGSLDDAPEAPAAPPKKLKKVARAQPAVETDATADAPPVASSGGTSGFVAVLASVPRSETSRIDALKTFADMQQKYGSALAGKTPDIASATLAKGPYDRLVVGPPGSREEASNVCSQLKAQGYKDCWVTAY
ncbi:SPOR domain-containing protein [Hyphomicrobium sp.]|uniref:SPOR domain-containing protein n=1 Tax=Hyphomicrobium sp. TaxID=82 RepID=UPI002D76E563|nr:SPOR domain-containing protein [Hyphomicrobium sp.]HET6389054.1 SPOR domain-containing protein [Hyphomicrobium sp.]